VGGGGCGVGLLFFAVGQGAAVGWVLGLPPPPGLFFFFFDFPTVPNRWIL